MEKSVENNFSNKKKEAGEFVIIKSKLVKPKVRDQFVVRDTLIEYLETNLKHPLTLVSAATGFGKSILISQWLDIYSHRYGWFSLDQEHNDVGVFLNYFVTLIRGSFPGKKFKTEYLQNNPGNLTANVIFSSMINDLDQLDGSYVLVLDDYHSIVNEEVHEILNGLLKYPSENLHLVIICQKDPPLKLTKLRAQFRMNELRMKDLVFTKTESLALAKSISSNLEREAILKLAQQADGWVTGLTAGILGLARGIQLTKVIESLNKPNSIISELFNEVILQDLGKVQLKYLALSCLPERFSQGLLEYLIESAQDSELKSLNVREFMIQSKRRNLFLISLDDEDTWFRYHHFFQSEIRRKVKTCFSETEVSELYVAISKWFEGEGVLEEALDYAIKSKNMDFAVELFLRYRLHLINNEHNLRLDRLTGKFEEETILNHLELIITKAMMQDQKANFSGMVYYLKKAEDWIAKNSISQNQGQSQIIGEYHSVFTFLLTIQGEFNQALFHGKKCLELLSPDEPNFFREYAIGWYAFAQQATGNAKEGLRRIELEFEKKGILEPYFQRRLYQGRCMVHLLERQISQLAIDGEALVKKSSPEQFRDVWIIGVYSLTYASYLSNQLENVNRFQEEVRLFKYTCRPFWITHQLFLECLTELAIGNWEKVEQNLEGFEEFAKELTIEPLTGLVYAFKTEVLLRRGELDQAKEVAKLSEFNAYPPVFFYYIPQLTEVKLLLSTHQEDFGFQKLEILTEMGKERHNKNLLVQAKLLKAVHFERGGNFGEAIKELEGVLDLVQVEEHTRIFLDAGLEIDGLISFLPKIHSQKNRLMELFQFIKRKGTSIHSKSNGFGPKTKQVLSVRELEIMDLVVQGYRNNEIADKLYISLDTVKKHLYRIFQKLRVNNRVGAIKKMKDLNQTGKD
ncbi:LuxR C-terminal-related transcriptional regulator [Algoriphagus taiwanensis]|uniref:HTH luxR-type domain-containing protein n=1 Tax=Algoriphagus taiwanensis TaxID=1445656 RepID=A0ABQ6Q4K5_9BACT|nr:hypothetical protein Ataiwa_33970 [Algoriphagus taiwanensis]